MYYSNFRKKNNLKKKIAFTLAEVLITLGIIGVVAAMTIPNLMTAFAKTRTETQLKGFYSKINQALRLSIADNGDPDGWVEYRKSYNYNEQVEFLNTYMFPYMKQLRYESCISLSGFQGVCITLIDGGGLWFAIDQNGADLEYYPDAKKMFEHTRDGKSFTKASRERFKFSFAKTKTDDNPEITSVNFVKPYTYGWDGTKEGLKKGIYACIKGCTICTYCTEIIHQNGWKIPKDYPW